MLSKIVAATKFRFRRLGCWPLHRKLARELKDWDACGGVIYSNNCIAGILYENARLQKASPTVGLFFSGPSFVRFLSDLWEGRSQSWSGLRPEDMQHNAARNCPELAVPGGGSVIFLHYADASEAAAKWNRRFARSLGRNALVIVSLRDGLESEMLAPVLNRFGTELLVENGAPAADELFYERHFLRRLSDHLATHLAARRTV